MSDVVKKAAKKFIKHNKKSLDIKTITEYLTKLGYQTIQFDSETNDIIKLYKLEHKVRLTPCFTCILNSNQKYVFINKNLPYDDKLYLILHEIGHVLLGHIGNNSISLHNGKFLDIQADAFAYEVLKPSKLNIKAYFIATITLISVLTFQITNNNTALLTDETISSAVISEYVYITRSGFKYHSANCIHTKNNNNCAKIERAEAIKLFTACSVCNP